MKTFQEVFDRTISKARASATANPQDQKIVYICYAADPPPHSEILGVMDVEGVYHYDVQPLKLTEDQQTAADVSRDAIWNAAISRKVFGLADLGRFEIADVEEATDMLGHLFGDLYNKADIMANLDISNPLGLQITLARQRAESTNEKKAVYAWVEKGTEIYIGVDPPANVPYKTIAFVHPTEQNEAIAYDFDGPEHAAAHWKFKYEELYNLVHTPQTTGFFDAVALEARFQIEKWGVEHDAGKSPFDFFWLIGYVCQKACHSLVNYEAESRPEDFTKAKHHIITTAAVLLNWFKRITGEEITFRPGIYPPAVPENTAAGGVASADQPTANDYEKAFVEAGILLGRAEEFIKRNASPENFAAARWLADYEDFANGDGDVDRSAYSPKGANASNTPDFCFATDLEAAYQLARQRADSEGRPMFVAHGPDGFTAFANDDQPNLTRLLMVQPRSEDTAAAVDNGPQVSHGPGMLYVGVLPDTLQVCLNLDKDRNGIGHILFTPDEAEGLGNIFFKQANRAAAQRAGAIDAAGEPSQCALCCQRLHPGGAMFSAGDLLATLNGVEIAFCSAAHKLTFVDAFGNGTDWGYGPEKLWKFAAGLIDADALAGEYQCSHCNQKFRGTPPFTWQPGIVNTLAFCTRDCRDNYIQEFVPNRIDENTPPIAAAMDGSRAAETIKRTEENRRRVVIASEADGEFIPVDRLREVLREAVYLANFRGIRYNVYYWPSNAHYVAFPDDSKASTDGAIFLGHFDPAASSITAGDVGEITKVNNQTENSPENTAAALPNVHNKAGDTCPVCQNIKLKFGDPVAVPGDPFETLQVCSIKCKEIYEQAPRAFTCFPIAVEKGDVLSVIMMPGTNSPGGIIVARPLPSDVERPPNTGNVDPLNCDHCGRCFDADVESVFLEPGRGINSHNNYRLCSEKCRAALCKKLGPKRERAKLILNLPPNAIDLNPNLKAAIEYAQHLADQNTRPYNVFFDIDTLGAFTVHPADVSHRPGINCLTVSPAAAKYEGPERRRPGALYHGPAPSKRSTDPKGPLGPGQFIENA